MGDSSAYRRAGDTAGSACPVIQAPESHHKPRGAHRVRRGEGETRPAPSCPPISFPRHRTLAGATETASMPSSGGYCWCERRALGGRRMDHGYNRSGPVQSSVPGRFGRLLCCVGATWRRRLGRGRIGTGNRAWAGIGSQARRTLNRLGGGHEEFDRQTGAVFLLLESASATRHPRTVAGRYAKIRQVTSLRGIVSGFVQCELAVASHLATRGSNFWGKVITDL